MKLNAILHDIHAPEILCKLVGKSREFCSNKWVRALYLNIKLQHNMADAKQGYNSFALFSMNFCQLHALEIFLILPFLHFHNLILHFQCLSHIFVLQQ